MEARDQRLVHEAIKQPVRNAFRIGLEFMDQNRTLAAVTMGAFVLLFLLQLVPVIGFFASVALGIISQAVQIYVGRAFYASDTMEGFAASAKATGAAAFMTQYKAQAFGAWLGWSLFGVALLLLFILLIAMTGVDFQHLDQIETEAEVMKLVAAVGAGMLPVILVVFAVTYVYPIVQGRVVLSESFGGAFKAVFSIFSPTVWAAAMQRGYFSFVLVFSLALTGMALLVFIVMALLMLIPVLGVILMMVWMIFLLYAFVMISSVACMIAYALAARQ